MQSHPIHAAYASPLTSGGARKSSLASLAILLALTSACSNAAPTTNQPRDSNESVQANAGESKRVVGYLPNYRGTLSEWTRTLDFSALTHVDLAFAAVETGTDGLSVHYREDGVASGDEPGLAAFVAKAHANGVQVCLAVGGAGQSKELGEVILKAPHELAEKLARYAQDHDLDCIDADQEEEEPTPELDAAYAEFIRDLATRLHREQKQLSAAVAQWNPDKILPVMDQFDFLNVMAYDFNDPWNSTTPVQTSSLADARAELDWWVSSGAQKTKLVLGVPFYGYQWSGGTGEEIAYQEVVDAFGGIPTQDLVKVRTSTITLNSSATIRSKAELAKSGYGGVMIWELGQDASSEKSLLHVIKDVMQ